MEPLSRGTKGPDNAEGVQKMMAEETAGNTLSVHYAFVWRCPYETWPGKRNIYQSKYYKKHTKNKIVLVLKELSVICKSTA